MKTKTSKTREQMTTDIYNKNKEFLFTLHAKCKAGGVFKIQDLINDFKISNNGATALNGLKFTKNIGSRRNPKYKWDTIDPNPFMVRALIDATREIGNKYSRDNYNKSKKKENKKTRTTETVIAKIKVTPRVEVEAVNKPEAYQPMKNPATNAEHKPKRTYNRKPQYGFIRTFINKAISKIW